MAFNFLKLLGVVKEVSKTNTFNLAAELAFRRIGQEIDRNSNNPDVVKSIARELITDAPAIVGAVVKGTQAEPLVDPVTIHRNESGPG